MGEGPNFPAVARAISDWLPEVTRARALAWTLVSVPLSLAIGGPIISYVLIGVGWRWMFVLFGLFVLLWWPFWWYFYSNRPEQSRYVNQEELSYIQQDQSSEIKRVNEAIVWRTFLTNPTILSNNWAFFVFGYGLFFYLTWLPDYLEISHQLNIKEVGLFSFLPWFLGALLLWSVGFLSDYVFIKTKKLRYARSYLIMLGQLLSFVSVLPIIFWHSMTVALVCLSLTIAFSLSNNTVFYATNIDVMKERAGSALALMNAGFALSGFIAPTLTGWLVQETGTFQSAFILLMVLTLSSVITVFLAHHPDDKVSVR